MGYKLRIDKKTLGDLILLFLFDKMFDEDFISENEHFTEFANKIENKGLKSYLFKSFFDIDPLLKSKYKAFRRDFDKETSITIIINENVEEEFGEYGKAIFETIKRITGKENPDIDKVNKFTENLLHDIMNKTKEEIE